MKKRMHRRRTAFQWKGKEKERRVSLAFLQDSSVDRFACHKSLVVGPVQRMTESFSVKWVIQKKRKIMPQLDKFTYFTQFFWLCLFFFTFYIALWNYGDGVIGISRILKLRKQLLSHQEKKIRRNDASLEDISRKGFRTSLSYMYSTLSEVSQWCQTVAFLVKGRIIALIFCFGEISGSQGIESQIPYLISKFSFHTFSSRITRRIENILHYISKSQRRIIFFFLG